MTSNKHSPTEIKTVIAYVDSTMTELFKYSIKSQVLWEKILKIMLIYLSADSLNELFGLLYKDDETMSISLTVSRTLALFVGYCELDAHKRKEILIILTETHLTLVGDYPLEVTDMLTTVNHIRKVIGVPVDES